MVTPLALISGATGTIGRAVTECLWRAGYSILALGRSPEKLQALHDWLAATPHSTRQVHYTVAMDFPDADYTRLTAYCLCHQKLGGDIALLAVCHGATPCPGALIEAADAFRLIWEIDVYSAMRLCATVVPSMQAQGFGHIVLLASSHSRLTYPARTAYASAKSAVCGLMRGLAVELGPSNIAVNALCPWQVEGGRTDAFIAAATAHGEELRTLYAARVPLRRLVSPNDIAAMVLFLAKNRSISGQELFMDCGLSATGWHKPFEPYHRCSNGPPVASLCQAPYP